MNEQFAATRRDYEFGDDDASSTWERVTARSHYTKDGVDAPSILVTNAEDLTHSDAATLSLLNFGDFYDILCVPHDSPTESILRVYLRIYPLVDPERQPPHLRQVAEAYSKIIWGAFETLLDPCQRAHCDLIDGNVTDDPEYNGAVLDPRLATCHGELSTSELGASFDFRETVKPKPFLLGSNKPILELIDFEIGHTVSINLSEPNQDAFHRKQRSKHFTTSGGALRDKECLPTSMTRRLYGTILTLQTSFYGFLLESLPKLHLFSGKSSFPRTVTRDRIVSLQDGRIRPQVAVSLQHVIPGRSSYHNATGTLQAPTLENRSIEEGTLVEIGSKILPDPIGFVSVSKSIFLPFDHSRSLLRLESEQILRERVLPRLAATLERPVKGGRMLVYIASGDHWRKNASEWWGFLRLFAGVNRTYPEFAVGLGGDVPRMFLSALRRPRVEISYKNGSAFRSHGSCIENERINQGIGALDGASNTKKGFWTVTAAAEPQYYSISTKYARDVECSALDLHQPLSISSKIQNKLVTDTSIPVRRPLRMEAEIGRDSFSAGYLALRCLKRVGRFSKVGFEIGLDTKFLFLSLYWSRLGRRINIPFFLCSGSSLRLCTLLMTTVIPFTGLAIWELWDRHQGRKRHQQRLAAQRDHQYIQKRRAEADTLTTLMAPVVQNRQKTESAANGLVILSAKYGVKARDAGEATAWGAAEVADVTVAVAALVDHGHLFIPSGVQKSRLLGFWDPEPTEEKVLHVRYSFQGREATVEVRGDDEQLELPPPWL